MSSNEGSATEEIVDEQEFAVTEDTEDSESAAVNEFESDAAKHEGNDVSNQRMVKPKKMVKNPQPKLNEQTMQGTRGITVIEKCFEQTIFKGRGDEEQDLNALIKTYEYWSHRLFPKFPFKASVEKLEKLGCKKGTKTHIKRIRHGLLVDDHVVEPEENDGLNVVGN